MGRYKNMSLSAPMITPFVLVRPAHVNYYRMSLQISTAHIYNLNWTKIPELHGPS
jgi:hypothetical protein